MPQPYGKKFTPERRKQLAVIAWTMFQELTAKGMSKTAAHLDIAGALDISMPTSRNLVLYGRRLLREEEANTL